MYNKPWAKVTTKQHVKAAKRFILKGAPFVFRGDLVDRLATT